jgi:hypothetical protein
VKRIAVSLVAVVASLLAGVTPSFAAGSSDAFENFQTRVTYTIYEPTYTAGLTANRIGGRDFRPACTAKTLWANYGEKNGKNFDLIQGNPMCIDIGNGAVVLESKLNGATLFLVAYCDPELQQKCTIADVKRSGGNATVQMPSVAGLRPTIVQIETFGAKNNLSGAQLVRIAKGLIPVG